MATMKKADWQKMADKLKIKYQGNDSVQSLVERIALKKKVDVTGMSLAQMKKAVLEVKAPKKVAAPKKKPTAKPKAKPSNDEVTVTVAKVLVDQDHRPSIMVEMKDGTQAWLPKDKVKRDGKKFTIPKYLKKLKNI